jgi:hypothetical protein
LPTGMNVAQERPRPSRKLSADEFSSWYWLKTEMVALCRLHGLGTAGSKLELEARIRGHLLGLTTEKKAVRRPSGEMPATFSLQSVIGRGWRCNPGLGAFFRTVCGRGFRFNAAMRDFIHEGEGKSLADAAICYHASVGPGANRPPIARQLEYNEHFREYFTSHPGATREEAIAAWWEKRSRKHGTRSA